MTPAQAAAAAEALSARVDAPRLLELYRDLHAHPELAFEEHRTAAIVERRLRGLGFDVTADVGGTGVVGVLGNGDGPRLLLRADMDALPITERTGLPYASRQSASGPAGDVTGVMHACGHDLHVVGLLGALEALVMGRDRWSGALVAVFQPAEETGAGARAMVDDGFAERFGQPDLGLAQHVDAFGVGEAATRSGLLASGAESLRVTVVGRGGHASTPEVTVDPVVVAASIVLRLQTIVSRELPPGEPAVVTVGSVHGGGAANAIPDHVEMLVNLRFRSDAVRGRLEAAVRRIVAAEAAAAAAPEPPVVEVIQRFPVTINDEPLTASTIAVLQSLFDVVHETPVFMGSEDFNVFTDPDGSGHRFPVCYWEFGGLPADLWAKAEGADFASRLATMPGQHTAFFAPEAPGAIRGAVLAMTGAALAALPDHRSPDEMNTRP